MQEETWCLLHLLQEVDLVENIHLDNVDSLVAYFLLKHPLKLGQLWLQLTAALTSPREDSNHSDLTVVEDLLKVVSVHAADGMLALIGFLTICSGFLCLDDTRVL